MPLVKNGKIASDIFMHVADGAELPGGGAVLVGLMVIGGELLHLTQEDWWHRSKLIPYGEVVGDRLRGMVGEHGEPWSKLDRLAGGKVRSR